MKSIVDIRSCILSRGAAANFLAPAVEPAAPGLAEQLTCAKRELALRRNTYPKWVAGGRMTGATAERETAAMAAIVETLERCLLLEEVSEEMRGGK